MQLLRTPEDRFAAIAEYPFALHQAARDFTAIINAFIKA